MLERNEQPKKYSARITMIDTKPSMERYVQKFLAAYPHIDFRIQPLGMEVSPFYDKFIDDSVRRFNPDLFLTEIYVGEGINFSVLRHYLDTFPNLPVVCCSKFISFSGAGRGNYERALKYGAVAALPKIPFPSALDILRYVPGLERHLL